MVQKRPDYSLEAAHDGLVAGVDEVGRGPLAGPVVAAAAVFFKHPSAELAALLDDSKKLTARAREKAFAALNVSAEVCIALGAASCADIDQNNIGGACHLAMRRAVTHLSRRLRRWPDLALVDGSHKPVLPCPVRMVIGGDGVSLSIAAASIMAKVVRDRLMVRLALRYPHYAWEKNSGYGTSAHKAGLCLAGVTPHHRRNFAPVRQMLAEKVHSA